MITIYVVIRRYSQIALYIRMHSIFPHKTVGSSPRLHIALTFAIIVNPIAKIQLVYKKNEPELL